MHFFTVSQLTTTRCRNLHHIDLRTCDDDETKHVDGEVQGGEKHKNGWSMKLIQGKGRKGVSQAVPADSWAQTMGFLECSEVG